MNNSDSCSLSYTAFIPTVMSCRIWLRTNGGCGPKCAVCWSRVCSPILHDAQRTARLFASVCICRIVCWTEHNNIL